MFYLFCFRVSQISIKLLYKCASWVVLVIKNPPANSGDKRNAGLIPGWGWSPGGGHGNPLQYSCLENPMDRGAWQIQSMGSQRDGHNWSDLAHINTNILYKWDIFIAIKSISFSVETQVWLFDSSFLKKFPLLEENSQQRKPPYYFNQAFAFVIQ